MEPDQRHADLIVQELGLVESNSVTTPGENEPKRKEGEHEEPLEEREKPPGTELSQPEQIIWRLIGQI